MATFSIMDNAATGGYIPYAASSVSDMLISYGNATLVNDNPGAALYDMPNTPINVAVIYDSYTSNGNFHINDLAFGIGTGPGGYAIGGIVGLNMTVNAYTQSFQTVIVNNGNDTFYGNGYSDFLHAGAGNDVLNGNGGNDYLYGDTGNDILWGDGGNDYLDGGTGWDTAAFAGNSWEYNFSRNGMEGTVTDKFGIDGSDRIDNVEMFSFDNGTFSFDQLFGPSAAPPPAAYVPPPAAPVIEVPAINHIYGTMGNDRMVGTAGNDILWSLAGKDVLTGGAGSDTFVFAKANKKNVDTIKDFSKADDYFGLDNAFFKGVGNFGDMKKAAFHSNNTGLAHDSNDRIIQDKNSGKIYYDADGTGSHSSSVLIANIQPNLKLAYTDFFVF